MLPFRISSVKCFKINLNLLFIKIHNHWHLISTFSNICFGTLLVRCMLHVTPSHPGVSKPAFIRVCNCLGSVVSTITQPYQSGHIPSDHVSKPLLKDAPVVVSHIYRCEPNPSITKYTYLYTYMCIFMYVHTEILVFILIFICLYAEYICNSQGNQRLIFFFVF